MTVLREDLRGTDWRRLASEGSRVYWAESALGRVSFIDLRTRDVDVLATHQSNPQALAPGNGGLYWLEFGGSDRRLETGDAKAVVGWDEERGTRVLHKGAVDSDDLLWSQGRVFWLNHYKLEIWSLSTDGGRPERLAKWKRGRSPTGGWDSPPYVHGSCADGTRLYWQTQSKYQKGNAILDVTHILSTGLDGGGVTVEVRLDDPVSLWGYESFIVSGGVMHLALMRSADAAGADRRFPGFVRTMGPDQERPRETDTDEQLEHLTLDGEYFYGAGAAFRSLMRVQPESGSACVLLDAERHIWGFKVTDGKLVWLEAIDDDLFHAHPRMLVAELQVP